MASPPSPLGHSSPLRSQSWPIGQLPGLSAVEQKQLTAGGICSTADLLGQTQSPSQRQAFSQKLGLHLKSVGKWVALADLARVPGVGCDYCGLLLHSGIGSVAHLAEASAHQLHPQVMRLYVATLQRRDLTPTVSQVAHWIERAKQLTSP
jgi:hypothetical protein